MVTECGKRGVGRGTILKGHKIVLYLLYGYKGVRGGGLGGAVGSVVDCGRTGRRSESASRLKTNLDFPPSGP